MPQLKSTLASKAEVDALPEALRGFYVEKDGKFVLDADFEDVGGLKSALQKERTGRETLEATLREIRKQLGDADPAKARAAMQKLQELEEKGLIDAGRFEELLKQRTERLAAEKDGTIKELTDKLSASDRRLAELVIDNELRAVATAKKVRPEAVEDFLRRGRDVYKLQDGKAIPVKPDGTVYYGKKPNEPMGMDEWADGIVTTAPHLFEGSSGSGAANNGGGGGGPKGPHTISAADARDRSKYTAAKAAADKAGQPLTIVE